MGQYAETEMGSNYRNGEENIGVFNTDKYTNNFMHELQRNDKDPPMINTSISTTNMKKNYKIWKEKTSTSPQGRHLRLYKTWLDADDKEDKDQETIQKDKFFEIITNQIETY